MKTLCIAPCGERKIWQKYPNAGPQKARNVYTGPYAGKCIEYSEKFYTSSWCILSAKYGFLFSEEIVPGPYDITFKKKYLKPINSDELSSQAEKKGLWKFDQIIVLGGKDYTKVIEEVFCGKYIYKPLEGLRIGLRMHKLNNAINTGKPL